MANPVLTVGVPASSELDAFGYRQELRRSLRLRDLLVYGLIIIVPTAPFSVFGMVFNASAGMVPFISWWGWSLSCSPLSATWPCRKCFR
jgi:hypothetical protein